MNIRFVTVIPLALAASLAMAEGDTFFTAKIESLLKQRCFECHSHEKKMKGGLTLDWKSGWEQGGDSGPAVVLGKPEESLLIKMVRWSDDEHQMPPKEKLPSAEIALLEEWVKRGAPDPRVMVKKRPTESDWWSLKPLVMPKLPEVAYVPAGGESPKHHYPATLPESVQRWADAVAARHRGITNEQFEQSAEMQQLGKRFFSHLESPEFQAKLKQAIKALKAVKGIEHGTLDFDLHDLTSPNARAWLEAALSDDPQPVQDYVKNLLDGAVFEFAFDPSSDSSSGGVTVKGETAPPSTAGSRCPG